MGSWMGHPQMVWLCCDQRVVGITLRRQDTTLHVSVIQSVHELEPYCERQCESRDLERCVPSYIIPEKHKAAKETKPSAEDSRQWCGLFHIC